MYQRVEPEGHYRCESHKRYIVWSKESPLCIRVIRERKHKFVAMSLELECVLSQNKIILIFMCAFPVSWLCKGIYLAIRDDYQIVALCQSIYFMEVHI